MTSSKTIAKNSPEYALKCTQRIGIGRYKLTQRINATVSVNLIFLIVFVLIIFFIITTVIITIIITAAATFFQTSDAIIVTTIQIPVNFPRIFICPSSCWYDFYSSIKNRTLISVSFYYNRITWNTVQTADKYFFMINTFANLTLIT